MTSEVQKDIHAALALSHRAAMKTIQELSDAALEDTALRKIVLIDLKKFRAATQKQADQLDKQIELLKR